MKTPEDIINRFINEENVKFNQERDDWMIEAMEEYAKLYHESEIKKLNIAAVVERSEQLKCEHKGRRTATELVEYCEDCKKILFHP